MKASFVFLILAWLYSCNLKDTSRNQEVIHEVEIVMVKWPVSVDVVTALETKKTFSLSEFGDQIHYIPLKGTPEILIAYILDLELTDNDLFVYGSHRAGIMRFNRSGEFLNKIGTYGNGPSELSPGSSFALVPGDSVVHVHRNFTHNDIWFSYEGQFLESPFVNKHKFASRFIPISSDFLLRLGSYRVPPEVIPDEFYEAAIFNRNNEMVSIVPSPLKNTQDWRKGGRNGSVSFWYSDSPTWYNGLIHFQAHTSDTIYEADQDTIYPKYILEKGKFAPPPALHKSPGPSVYGDPYDFIINQCVFESIDFILFRACFKGNEYLVRMDKKSGQLDSQELHGASYYNKPLGDVRLPMIANDIDHGVDFYPHFTNRKGDIWIYSITALDYKEEMEVLEKEGKIDLNDRSSEAVNLYHSLADEDNPILMLLDLSK